MKYRNVFKIKYLILKNRCIKNENIINFPPLYEQILATVKCIVSVQLLEN